MPVTLAAGQELAVVLTPRAVGDGGLGVSSSSTSTRRSATGRGARARRRARARCRRRRSSSSARRPRSRARASTAPRSRCPAARTSSSGASTRPTRDDRGRQRRRAGPAAVAGRGARRAADVVPRPGGGQRARRRAPRRGRARRPAADDLAGDRGRACRRVTPVDGVLAYAEGLDDRLPRRRRAAAAVRPRPRLHDAGSTSRWTARASRLANTGTRRGREVVQVYASRPDSAIERPPRWLAGFAVVEADAGEEVIVDVPLGPRAFQHWDGGWETEPGRSARSAGRSVADLRAEHVARWSCASSSTSRPSRATGTSRAPRRRSTSASPRSPSRCAGWRRSSGCAVPPHVEGRRADRGRRGPARPRRDRCWPRSQPRGRTWTATPASRAARAGRGDRRRRAAAARGARGLPRRPSRDPDRAAPGLGGRGRRARPARLGRCRRARADRRPAAGVDAHPLAEEPLRVAVASTTRSRARRSRSTTCAGGRSSSPSRAPRCARR